MPSIPLSADSPQEKRPPGLGLWDALEAKDVIPVYHFKWHAGLLANMKDRLEWYRCGEAQHARSLKRLCACAPAGVLSPRLGCSCQPVAPVS